jgi:hypothetical protein
MGAPGVGRRAADAAPDLGAPPRREELKDGWESPAWEELQKWTDDELRDLREHFEGTRSSATATTNRRMRPGVIAEDAVRRAKQLAAMDCRVGCRPCIWTVGSSVWAGMAGYTAPQHRLPIGAAVAWP